MENGIVKLISENGPYIGFSLYWGGLFFFLILELAASYRRPTVSKGSRLITNISLSIINSSLYHLVYSAAILLLLQKVLENRYGLLNMFETPFWFSVIAGLLILDFSIYLWHRINHKMPLLWRFHRVHHSDLNMDVSTANRFHLGEFLLSGLVRIAVIYVFGINLFTYILFHVLVNISIQFHHSSVCVPPLLDRLWGVLFVPPSMHRVHHSNIREEHDSNYGVILSIWDRMMGTLRRDVEQESIEIGLKYYPDFKRLGLFKMMIMPFEKHKTSPDAV